MKEKVPPCIANVHAGNYLIWENFFIYLKKINMQVPRILNPIVAVIESITRFVSVFLPWPILHNRCAEHPHVKEMIVNAHGSVKVTAIDINI